MFLKPPCHNGDPCHISAPRGSRTGIQGIKGHRDRSVYPALLCEHIVDVCEYYIDGKDTIQVDTLFNDSIL